MKRKKNWNSLWTVGWK